MIRIVRGLTSNMVALGSLKRGETFIRSGDACMVCEPCFVGAVQTDRPQYRQDNQSRQSPCTMVVNLRTGRAWFAENTDPVELVDIDASILVKAVP